VLIPIAGQPGSDTFHWFLDRLSDVLGQPYRIAFAETVERLATSELPEQPLLEAARWRAGISDALAEDPALAEDLHLLFLAARARLDAARR
jgi:hypothetical protein